MTLPNSMQEVYGYLAQVYDIDLLSVLHRTVVFYWPSSVFLYMVVTDGLVQCNLILNPVCTFLDIGYIFINI